MPPILVKDGDELFLDIISSRRQFFNPESPDYKDSNVRDAAMAEISKIMNEPGIFNHLFT